MRLQKAEKERDDLLETNSRLLKQNMEKDDMNAKSLSTILHLKSLTEQAEKEKEARELEAKSAEQVSLAARLAENAKDRVAEEALKEKKVSKWFFFSRQSFSLRTALVICDDRRLLSFVIVRKLTLVCDILDNTIDSRR